MRERKRGSESKQKWGIWKILSSCAATAEAHTQNSQSEKKKVDWKTLKEEVSEYCLSAVAVAGF